MALNIVLDTVRMKKKLQKKEVRDCNIIVIVHARIHICVNMYLLYLYYNICNLGHSVRQKQNTLLYIAFKNSKYIIHRQV